MINKIKLVTTTAVLSLLSACGGGGDSGGGGTPAQGVISSTQLFFGNVSVGQTSGPRTAVINNPGSQPLIFSRVESSSNSIANFQITNTCTNTLAPGASCTITFVCAPVKPNSGNVDVYFYHNGSRLGGDLVWHLQTYSYVTLTCQ
jgi:hypothetical protein